MFQDRGTNVVKKLDAGWGELPLAASLCVLLCVAPALGQSATGGGAPMSIQPATQPQSDGARFQISANRRAQSVR